MSFLDTIFQFSALGRRNATPPAPANGDLVELQVGPTGRLLVDIEQPDTLWVDSGPPVAEKLIKGSAGTLFQVLVTNQGGSDAFVFIFNHATAGGTRPADGVATQKFVPFAVEAGKTVALTLPRARPMSTGIYVGASSTADDFTYDSTADLLISAEYL